MVIEMSKEIEICDKCGALFTGEITELYEDGVKTRTHSHCSKCGSEW